MDVNITMTPAILHSARR